MSWNGRAGTCGIGSRTRQTQGLLLLNVHGHRIDERRASIWGDLFRSERVGAERAGVWDVAAGLVSVQSPAGALDGWAPELDSSAARIRTRVEREKVRFWTLYTTSPRSAR